MSGFCTCAIPRPPAGGGTVCQHEDCGKPIRDVRELWRDEILEEIAKRAANDERVLARIEARLQRLESLFGSAPNGHPAPEDRLLDAKEVAGRIDKPSHWVRRHASELGAKRMGTDAKPRYFFHWPTVVQRLGPPSEDQQPAKPSKPKSRRRRARRTGTAELLPIRGGDR